MWLTYDDRKKIEKLYLEGTDVKEIAEDMGKHFSTIYKELHKGTTGEMDKNGRPGYSAELAQEAAFQRRYKKRSGINV